MHGRHYDSRFLSFSTTSRFSSFSADPSEVSKRDEASPYFPSGTSSPALASVSFLLRSSMSLKRFMPVPARSEVQRDGRGGHDQRETGKRPSKPSGDAVAHPTDSSTVLSCSFCHDTTLQHYRLCSVT